MSPRRHTTSSPGAPDRLPEAPAPAFPFPPARLFMIGIGGVGMSALAALLRRMGYDIAGSDRDLSNPGRSSVFERLQAAGIRLYPQDGSGPRSEQPDAVVYTSAVEPGNPDLPSNPDVPAFRRARVLAAAAARLPARTIAVAGSAGKTTVTAWIATTLNRLGRPTAAVCGGSIRDFEQFAGTPANFFAPPDPEWIVFEADESDGSLVEYTPDVGIVLNIGTDHLERSALEHLFRSFLKSSGRRVVSVDLAGLVRGFPETTYVFVPPGSRRPPRFRAAGFTGPPCGVRTGPDGLRFTLTPGGRFHVQSQFGNHSAANACAVVAAVRAALQTEIDIRQLKSALCSFAGVRRRFERVGTTPAGATVIDDFAHNVEKIASSLATAQALSERVVAVFQPHGYGPLGFMRKPLMQILKKMLRSRDLFVFLPVYYAGGTTSFRPTSEEVAEEAGNAGPAVVCARDRDALAAELRAAPRGTMVLIMGARDPSLSAWAESLTIDS